MRRLRLAWPEALQMLDFQLQIWLRESDFSEALIVSRRRAAEEVGIVQGISGK